MLEQYGFDLIAWLAGEARGTPHMVMAMIQELPEGSRFAALMSAPERREGMPEFEPDPEREAFQDRRFWTADRRLYAQQINALHHLILLTGHWKKGKEPQFPVIGPLEWQPQEQRKELEKSKSPASVEDVLRKFGWNG